MKKFKSVKNRLQRLIDDNPELKYDKDKLFIEYHKQYNNIFWDSEHETTLKYLKTGIPYSTIDRSLRKIIKCQ